MVAREKQQKPRGSRGTGGFVFGQIFYKNEVLEKMSQYNHDDRLRLRDDAANRLEEMKEKVEDTSKKSEVMVEITSPSYIERFHEQAKQCSTSFFKGGGLSRQ